MASLKSLLSGFLLLAGCAQALKFDLEATSSHHSNQRRCIRNFVNKDTLVVVTATLDGYKGDGMNVNMHVGALPRGCKLKGLGDGLWGGQLHGRV